MNKARIIMFFCLIVLLPSLSYIIKTDVRFTNYEGRKMAEKPLLIEPDFCEKFDDYYADNSPWRNEMVTLNSCLSTFVFKDSSSKDNIKGKDGWYFYRPDELDEYKRINLLSDDELDSKVNDISLLNSILDSEGVELYIFVAPDKSEIYEDMVPRWYKRYGDICRAEQVGRELALTDVNYVFPVDELKKTADELENSQLYYKLDTHWNYLGGYVGCKSLLKQMDIELPDVSELTMETTYNVGSSAYGKFDISNGLGMAAVFDKDISYNIDGYNYSDSIEYSGDLWSNMEDFYGTVSSHNEDAPIKKRLLFVRDSFGTAMYPVLGNIYEDVISPHRNNIGSVESLLAYEPDVIVWETVERSLSLPCFAINN